MIPVGLLDRYPIPAMPFPDDRLTGIVELTGLKTSVAEDYRKIKKE